MSGAAETLLVVPAAVVFFIYKACKFGTATPTPLVTLVANVLSNYGSEFITEVVIIFSTKKPFAAAFERTRGQHMLILASLTIGPISGFINIYMLNGTRFGVKPSGECVAVIYTHLPPTVREP